MPTTSIDSNTTLRQLLIAAPEHGPVLECLGVNAVRDGGRTLAELCRSRGLETHTAACLLAAMRDARRRAPAVCVELMTLVQLCDHLENAQRNLHNELKRLDRLTKTLAKENAMDDPKLLAIRKSFVAFQRRFKAHLRKESEQLFPVYRRWAANRNEARHARSFLNPALAQLQREHNQADEALADLRSLVAGDASFSSARAAVKTTADAIARLEHAVHEQIYKENHVLFPKALPMRQAARVGRRDFSRSAFCPRAIDAAEKASSNKTNERCHEPNRRRLP